MSSCDSGVELSRVVMVEYKLHCSCVGGVEL